MRGWRAVAALIVVAATALLIPPPQAQAPPASLPVADAAGGASDYAYKWNPATWGFSGSYFEWWYLKVSEIPNRPDDPTPGVQENYFFVIEVVNPWDTHEPPKEPTTGVYIYFGSMLGESRRMLMEKLPLSAFSSASSTRADVRVCADALCSNSATLATDPVDPDRLTLRMTFNTRDPNLVVVDRVGATDPVESALPPGAAAPPPVTDYSRLSVQFSIRRTVGFHPRAADQVPDGSNNPVINWLVFAVDGQIEGAPTAAPAISWLKTDGSAENVLLPSSGFRAYADTNWGTAFPQAWIWSQATWPGTGTTFTLGGGCPVGIAQCRDGMLPTDTWSGMFFLQFLNHRTTPPQLETYSHSAAEPLDGWRVTAQVSTARQAYVDGEGWWQIPQDWSVSFEDLRGCTVDSGATDRRKVTIEVSAASNRIFDLNISSPWMKLLGGTPGDGLNGASDPFHDFEALEATAKLWMWYCDGESGAWVAEVAPDGSHNWPIVAPIGTYEFGLFQGRVDLAEVYASAAVATLDGQTATVDFFGKNIGGKAAQGVTVSLTAREFNPSLGLLSSRPICTSAVREGARGEWLAPGERQDGSDTLAQACSFTVGSGHAIVVDPPALSTAQPTTPQGGGGTAVWTSQVQVHSCEIFETVVTTASRQMNLNNDVRATTWCPFSGQTQVQLSLGANSPATFADGTRTMVISADPNSPAAVSFLGKIPSGGALEIPLTVTRLDTGYSTVAIVRAQSGGAQAPLAAGDLGIIGGPLAADVARSLRP
jgi:hypothetical protein